MSYRGGGPSGAGEQGRNELPKGSVRAARERLQAEKSQWAKRQQGVDALDSTSPRRENVPGPPTGSVPEKPVVYPQQSPTQWPLPVRGTGPGSSRALQQQPPAINPPTFLDTSRDTMSPNLQPPQAAYYANDQYLSPASSSPNMSRPLTDSSYASDSSSIGTIPDFPVPSGQAPPARNRNQPYMGPPPSARKGQLSYYSQMSYVSPIVEESTEARASVGSFASSNVFPTDQREFYLEDASDEEEAAGAGAGVTTADSPPRDQTEKSGLVRQASLGKRTKPTLTNIKGGDNPRPNLPPNAPMSAASARSSSQQAQRSRVTSPLGGGSILFDPSSSSSSSERSSLRKLGLKSNASKESLNKKERTSYDIMGGGMPQSPPPGSFRPPPSRTVPASPLVPIDSRVEHILGGLEKGGALSPGTQKEFGSLRKGSLADRVGSRRPARLNVDAVRDAEARGSLTSLPDLIKRATKLAANLDRGKTASRLGFEWGDGGRGEKLPRGGWGPIDRQGNRRSTTLSGMLSAFPPPGTRSPGSPRTAWPDNSSSARSLYHKGSYTNSRGQPRNGRRCCGIPLCTFILVVFLIVIMVAAAIIIPIVLIVLPKRHAAASGSAGSNAVCEEKASCQNGGSSVSSAGGTCSCLCTNGFTGPRCQNPSDAGCTTRSIGGIKNASVGTGIAPLLDAATSTYSIPLDGSNLLSLFASTNMTCGAENALVTMTGSSASKRSEKLLPNQLIDRSPSGHVVTSNGIIVATGTPSAATPTTQAAATTTAPLVFVTGSSAPGTNATSREFAKVGVLFVLQESRQINTAIKAQEQLSNYMNAATKQGSTMSLAHNVTLGNGYFIDLWFWTVTLANGTIYGVGSGWNGTPTAMPT